MQVESYVHAPRPKDGASHGREGEEVVAEDDDVVVAAGDPQARLPQPLTVPHPTLRHGIRDGRHRVHRGDPGLHRAIGELPRRTHDDDVDSLIRQRGGERQQADLGPPDLASR